MNVCMCPVCRALLKDFRRFALALNSLPPLPTQMENPGPWALLVAMIQHVLNAPLVGLTHAVLVVVLNSSHRLVARVREEIHWQLFLLEQRRR